VEFRRISYQSGLWDAVASPDQNDFDHCPRAAVRQTHILSDSHPLKINAKENNESY